MPLKKGFSKKSYADHYKLAICEYCKNEFRFLLIHSGFNNTAYFYCDSCGTTALLDIYNENYPNKVEKEDNKLFSKN